MKRVLIVLCFWCSFVTLFSQQHADIIISYDSGRMDFSKDIVVNEKMTLLCNKDISKYFNDISQWSDSLSSTPGGEQKLKDIIMANCVTQMPDGSIRVDYTKGPVKNIYTYVLTDNNEGQLTHYDKWGNEKRFYKEPIDEISWEIGDSTKNILGYECVIAEADYHGRHWTVWFTPEIPVSFGPWKLHGLPGLILSADTGDGFDFIATGIQTSDRVITPVYGSENYSKTDRKKALADEEYYQNNRRSIISAQFGGNVQFSPGFDEKKKYDGKKYSIESDY